MTTPEAPPISCCPSPLARAGIPADVGRLPDARRWRAGAAA